MDLFPTAVRTVESMQGHSDRGSLPLNEELDVKRDQTRAPAAKTSVAAENPAQRQDRCEISQKLVLTSDLSDSMTSGIWIKPVPALRWSEPCVTTFCQQHEYKSVSGPFKTPTQLSPPANRHQKGVINNGIYSVVDWFLNCLFRLLPDTAIDPDSLKSLREMYWWISWQVHVNTMSLFLLVKWFLLI